MEIHEHMNKMRKIYPLFLEFLDCTVDEKEENLRTLIDMINTQNILEDFDEIYEILVLISKVSENHYRNPDFFDKIENILIFFEEKIKQNFTSFQLFNIFKSNKRILLFLFNQKIIEIDQTILNFIINSEKEKYKSYKFYFFNEIKEKISKELNQSIEGDLLLYDLNVFENFHEKCLLGENESYICSLIRSDSVKEFIIYINQNNISLSSRINKSIFETNSLLISKEPALIEYSAFYGSIQIFQFLLLNHVKIESILWKYSIHGRNPEIIHILEENHVDSGFFFYISIKCHHNEIAHYFEDNFSDSFVDLKTLAGEKGGNVTSNNIFMRIYKKFVNSHRKNKKDERNRIKDRIFDFGFCYHNYDFMPEDLNDELFFKNFCEFNYIKLVKLFLEKKIVNVNDKFNNQKKGKTYYEEIHSYLFI